MGDQYDAPNQQVVRPDGSAPWDEGDGGPEQPEPQPEPESPADPLDAMTKDELIQVASDRGLDVNAAMTKAEIRAVIDAG